MSRRLVLLCAVLILLHLLLVWMARAPGVLTAQDDSRYILLGQSLRSLEYREIWRVDAPLHHVYPPVFPAVLALTGASFPLIVALQALASAAAIALAAALVWRLWSPLAAVCTLAALAVNPVLIAMAGVVRSETLFTLLGLAAVSAAAWPGFERNSRMAAAAGLAIIAALTRSVGVTLLAGLGADWLLRRRWRALAVLVLASVATVGLWLWWSTQAAAQHVGESYVADVTMAPPGRGALETFALRIRWNLQTYLTRSIPSALAFPTVPNTPIDNLIGVLVICITLAAGAIVLWRRARAPLLYLATALGLYLVWPWSGTRFLVPLIPLMVPAALAGAEAVARRGPRRLAALAMPVLALLLVTGGSLRTGSLVRRMQACDRSNWQQDDRCMLRDQVSYFAALDFIRDSLPADAVFLSAKPEPIYLYTGRKTAPLRDALARPADSLLSYLDRHQTRFVLISSLQAFELEELPDRLDHTCRSFRVRRAFPPRSWLLERQDSTGATEDACATIDAWRTANANRNFQLDRIMW